MDENDTGQPAWWHKARKLEAEGQLVAAEKLVKDSVPNLYFAEVTANLYRFRMRRLMTSGDAVGAKAAFLQSKSFIYFLAAQATSGGEGLALSGERDAFMRELVAEYGSNPDA